MYLVTKEIKNFTEYQKIFVSRKAALVFFKEEVKKYMIEKHSFLNDYTYQEYLNDLCETCDAYYLVSDKFGKFTNYGTIIEFTELSKPTLYQLKRADSEESIYTETVAEGSEAYVYFHKTVFASWGEISPNAVHAYYKSNIIAVRERQPSEQTLSSKDIFNLWRKEKTQAIEKAFEDTLEKECAIDSIPQNFSVHAIGHIEGKLFDVFLHEKGNGEAYGFSLNQFIITTI